MTERSQGGQTRAFAEMSTEEIEQLREGLTQGTRRLNVNPQALFRHAGTLPPARRAAVLIAGWGPVALFPFVPLLYFLDWRYSLFTLFLGIFWVGMGRKYAQAAIRRQCFTDAAFLKSALASGLVTLG